MTRVLFPLLLAVSTIVAVVGQNSTQGGDQFLDGIGETGLITRYVFNGNAEDSSRNQLHATVRSTGGVFVDDSTQRQVLLLTGEGSHVQLPAGALAGEDAIAVWDGCTCLRARPARSSTSARALRRDCSPSLTH